MRIGVGTISKRVLLLCVVVLACLVDSAPVQAEEKRFLDNAPGYRYGTRLKEPAVDGHRDIIKNIVESKSLSAEKGGNNLPNTSDIPLILIGGFLVAGMAGLFLLMITVRRTETMKLMQGAGGGRYHRLPVFIFVAMAASSYVLYNMLEQQELRYMKKLVQDEASKIEVLVNAQTKSNFTALKRMAERWSKAGGTPYHLWQDDVRHYAEDFKSLETVAWVDSTYRVRWADPLKSLTLLIERNIASDTLQRKALEDAAARHASILTPPLTPGEEHSAFVIYYPLYSQGRFEGFLAGVFSIEDFFGHAIAHELGENFILTASYQGTGYYNSNHNQLTANTAFAVDSVLQIQDKEWALRIIPTEKFVQAEQTRLPQIVFGAGLLIAWLSALSVRFILMLRLKSNYLERSNKQILEATKKKLEAELRHQQIIDGVKDYAIYLLDLKGTVESWNSGAERIKGYQAEEIIGQNFSRFYTQEDQETGLPQKALEIACAEGAFKGEGWRVRKDGSLLWGSVSISAIRDAHGVMNGFATVTRDMTEQQQFEKALLESEERYDLVVRGMSVGLWDWNIQANTLYWSQQFKNILGITDAGFIPSHDDFLARLHPDDRVATEKALAGHLKRFGPYDVEYRLRHDNGTYVWVHACGQAQWDALGVPLRMAGSVDDITLRRLVEQRFKDQAAQVLAITDTVLDGLITIDDRGIIKAFNRAASRIFGYQAEEVIGENISTLMPAPYQAQHDRYLHNYITTGERKIIGIGREVEGKRKDGTIFPMELGVNEMDLAGDGRMFVGTIRDISARKQQEQALRTSEETFRSAIENASIGMALVDLSGRWLKVNDALCAMLGYDEEALLQNDFQSITHPDDLATDLRYLQKLLDGEIKACQLEKRYYHHSGRVIWAQLSVSLVRYADGTPHYFIAQIQDISEQKEIERLKNEFISIVSHELRTPLTSIRGSLGLVLGAMAKGLDEKVAKLLGIAYQNCERLILLINDILDIDKIAAGQMDFSMKRELLAPLIRQAIEANQPYADKFNVSLKALVRDDSLEAMLEAARLLQVLANLISNAVKFSHAGGSVEILLERQGAWARVSVIDHGQGIAEEFRSRIFGKFSQADSSATRSKGGTGLGLHISKQIIEKMKGTIGFATKTGKGTTFWVDLPLAEQKTNEEASPDASALAFVGRNDEVVEGYRILHVEEDLDFSNMLAAALHGRAHVTIARTLADAKAILESRQFDLVVIDIGMPDGSGLDLLKNINGLSYPKPKVMILSAQEPAPSFAKKVAKVIVKSRVHENIIVRSIMDVLNQHKKEGES